MTIICQTLSKLQRHLLIFSCQKCRLHLPRCVLPSDYRWSMALCASLLGKSMIWELLLSVNWSSSKGPPPPQTFMSLAHGRKPWLWRRPGSPPSVVHIFCTKYHLFKCSQLLWVWTCHHSLMDWTTLSAWSLPLSLWLHFPPKLCNWGKCLQWGSQSDRDRVPGAKKSSKPHFYFSTAGLMSLFLLASFCQGYEILS